MAAKILSKLAASTRGPRSLRNSVSNEDCGGLEEIRASSSTLTTWADCRSNIRGIPARGCPLGQHQARCFMSEGQSLGREPVSMTLFVARCCIPIGTWLLGTEVRWGKESCHDFVNGETDQTHIHPCCSKSCRGVLTSK